jgi:hypothetical protein
MKSRDEHSSGFKFEALVRSNRLIGLSRKIEQIYADFNKRN